MLHATDYADTDRRQALLRELFGSMGKGVHVDIDFHCEYGKNIFIGNKVIVNMNCTFVDNHRIDIGDNVLIAPNVQIYIRPRILSMYASGWFGTGRKAMASAIPLLVPSRLKTVHGLAEGRFCYPGSRLAGTALSVPVAWSLEVSLPIAWQWVILAGWSSGLIAESDSGRQRENARTSDGTIVKFRPKPCRG